MVPDRRPALRPLLTGLSCLFCAALVWTGCDADSTSTPLTGAMQDEDPGLDLPPKARATTYLDLIADVEAERHPSDGGGTARLTSGPTEVTISTRASWSFEYEAGPLGIAEGGMLYFMTSPFWGWDDTPQVDYAGAPGYTEVETDADGIELEAVGLNRQMLGVRIGGRELREGETIRLRYGVGVGSVADRYHEKGSTFWFAVDGDGDGVRGLVEDCPTIDVVSAPVAGLWLTASSTAKVGETARLTLALLDSRGNSWVDWAGHVEIVDVPDGVSFPGGTRHELTPGYGTAVTLDVNIESGGLYTFRARLDPPLLGTPDDFAYESNPLHATESARHILWADLHGHSQLSDGTGTPEDFYRYARDVAALDVAVLTDHDHWGVRFIDQHPEVWAHIGEVTKSFHDPGRFVTLLGYEWTSWLYGHRHVVYFTDEGTMYSSVDPDYETPTQLWEALEGQEALTFAHHSAGGPIGTDWSFVPDPEIEPVTEVMSVHGSSEAADSPQRIYRGIPGNYVRDVLDRGIRFGFIGSGDSHDGHPGLAHLASASGGVAAILAEERTREAVLDALRSRRVYATSGQRILLRASLGGHRMGATIPADEAGPLELRGHVVGTGPIERLDVVRSGEVVSLDAEGASELVLPPLELDLESGDYLYLRVVQEDGGLAWSSPFYVD